jgi:hypothetical protein
MPKDPRKRQKQQERRTAKRKSKQLQLRRAKHAGLAERLTSAAASPVLHSWVTEDLWTQGLGWACLSRELPNGYVACAVFLVDRYCLGVKNVLADVMPRSEYEEQIARKMCRDFEVRDMQPAAVRKLVEGAVEYARGLGLYPHADYARARHLFGALNPADSTEVFEFGKDGMPFFVAGPNDSPERCRQILNALVQACGVDGFHYMIPVPDPGRYLPQTLQHKPMYLADEADADEALGEDGDWSEDDSPDGGSA